MKGRKPLEDAMYSRKKIPAPFEKTQPHTPDTHRPSVFPQETAIHAEEKITPKNSRSPLSALFLFSLLSAKKDASRACTDSPEP